VELPITSLAIPAFQSAAVLNFDAALAAALNPPFVPVPPALYRSVDTYFANRYDSALRLNVVPVETSHIQGLTQEPQASGMGSPADADNSEDPPDIQPWWCSS